MARLDPTVFEALVREHHVAVYRAAWRVLRRAEDAEDVAQEVFLRVLDGRLDLASAAAPEGVLVWAAARAALSRGRSETARHAREERHAMSDERTVQAPVQAAEEAESRALVYDAIRALPEPHQAALVLRFQEGLTFAAVGRALGISEPSAMERVSKGLAQLERRLGRVGFAAVLPLAGDGDGASLSALLADAAPAPRAALAGELARLAAHQAVGAVASAKSTAALWPALAVLATLAVAVPVVISLDEEGSETRSEVSAARPGADPDLASTASARDGRGAGAESERVVAGVAELAESGEQAAHGSSGSVEENPARVTVHVTDQDGAPVPEAMVRAFVRAPGLKFPSENVSATTDGGGLALLELAVDSLDPLLREQDWAVLVDHPAAPRVSTTLAELSSGEERALTLELQASAAEAAYEVDVLVTDEDGPIAGAVVALGHVVGALGQGGECRREAERTLTGPDGRVTLRGQWLGEKLVVVDARALGRSHAKATLRVDGPGVYDVQVSCLPAWEISGVARAAHGGELGALKLSLFPDEDGWRRPYLPDWWAVPSSVRVDADGRFRLFASPDQGEALGAGPLWLGIATSDLGPWSPFALRIDGPTEQVELVVKRESDPTDAGAHLAEIHGRLVAPEGVELPWWPARWARVVHVPEGLPDDELEEDFLPAVLLGDYPRERTGQRAAAQVLLPSPMPAGDVRRVLDSVGSARAAAGQGLQQLGVQVDEPQQAEISPQGMAQMEAAENNGELVFHRVGLAPGRVLVMTDVHGFAPVVLGPINLGANEVLSDVELELDPGRSASGVVLGSNGLPLAGALVTVAGRGARADARLAALDDWLREHPRAASYGRISARTDRFGRFELTGVPAGRGLQLAVAHPGHVPSFEALSKPASEPIRVSLTARR